MTKDKNTAGGASELPEFTEADRARIRDELFGGGVGYKQPPKAHQFKKGQSGNPNGRPKAKLKPREDSYAGLLPLTELILEEGRRTIPARDGNQIVELSAWQAVLRATLSTALRGGAYAQKHLLDYYAKSQREEAEDIAREIEIWEYYTDRTRREIVEAQERGLPIPNPLPHPDDIIIKPGRRVRFTGPLDEAQARSTEETCRLRDVLILQDALDHACWPEDSEDEPCGALLLATVLNELLPKRLQLEWMVMVLRWDRCNRMPIRTLLKEVHQSWKDLSHPVPRGTTLFGRRRAQECVQEVVAMAKAVREGHTADGPDLWGQS